MAFNQSSFNKFPFNHSEEEAAAAPFSQTDWPNPLGWRREFRQRVDLKTSQPGTPSVTFVAAGSLGAINESALNEFPLNEGATEEDSAVPFVPYDWPNPLGWRREFRQPVDLKTSAQARALLAVGISDQTQTGKAYIATAVCQTDWPNPLGWSREHRQPVDLKISQPGTPSVTGFVSVDQTQTGKANIASDKPPLSFDWPNPAGWRKEFRTAIDLNAWQQGPTESPFLAQDWPNPMGWRREHRQPVDLRTGSQSLALLLPVDRTQTGTAHIQTAVHQTEWPNPLGWRKEFRTPVDLKTWHQAHVLLPLETTTRTQTGKAQIDNAFRQTDWPNPSGWRREFRTPLDLKTWSQNLIQFPRGDNRDQLQPGKARIDNVSRQTDWPNPVGWDRRFRTAVDLKTWHQSHVLLRKTVDRTRTGKAFILNDPPSPASRFFNGTSDWIKLPIVGVASVTNNFTMALWLKSGDVSGLDKALISGEAASSGAQSNVGFGFYWNNTELKVKYYYINAGNPSGPGIFEEMSVPYATPVDTAIFVAVTATAASPPTFTFYAGETVETITQVGTPQTATNDIKATTNRNLAVGASTTGPDATQTADGYYFTGYFQAIGIFYDQSLTEEELLHYALTRAPMTVYALDDYGYPNGQVFEIWGENPENDHSLNFWQTESINGTTVAGPIAPDTPWSHVQMIDWGQGIDAMIQLDDGSILAELRKTTAQPIEIWKSSDGGDTWIFQDTLGLSGQLGGPHIAEMFVEIGGGTVIAPYWGGSGEPAGFYQSTDYGANWTFLSTIDPAVNYIATAIRLSNGDLVVGTSHFGNLYTSTDDGATWSLLSSLNTTSNEVTSIADLGGGVLLAGSGNNEIYRSTDSGATWTATPYATLTPGFAGGVVMRYMGGGVVLAGTSFGDIYYSADSGATWVRSFDGADVYLNFFHTLGHYAFFQSGTCTFAATRKFQFILVSPDGGQTWVSTINNPRGVSTGSFANVLTSTDFGPQRFLTGGDSGYFVDIQNIWEVDLSAILGCNPSEVRVVNERRVVAWTNPCANDCCYAPDPGPNAPPPPPKYVTRNARDLAQIRVSAWTGETPPPPGAVNVTQTIKLIEYREPPQEEEDGGGINPESFATCSLRVMLKIVRVSDLVQVFELDQYARLEYTKRWTEMDDFTLKMSADTEQARRMIELGIVPTNGKFILNVFIEGLPDFAGFIDNVTVDITNRGEHIWTLRGLGVDRILSDRAVLPPAGEAYDRYEGQAETIMKSLVTRHAVSPITTGVTNLSDADRAISQLMIAVDAALGSSVKFEGRFQKLHEGLLQISRSSNDIGFGVKLIDQVLIFEVSQGVDRSRQCVLAVELDNLGDFMLNQDGTQFVSHVVMGGRGEDAERTLLAVSTETSTRTGIERREAFQDARDLDTEIALNDKGVSFLQERGLIVTLGANKLTGTHPCYRRDFIVGDFVTMRNAIYDFSQVTRVMEARVSVEGGRLEQVDLVFAKPRKNPIKFMRTSPSITASSRV